MTGSGLLQGTRVLELSIWRPGPYAAGLMAALGADVIKLEPPGGDPLRAFIELFEEHNAGKRSICLNLREPGPRARALELAAQADVVVEGARPGVADRLGVGYDAVRAVNPRVVYCSVAGFGQTGPLAAVPGHDMAYQAYSGFMAPLGPPADGRGLDLPAIPVGDLASGLLAFAMINAALVNQRERGIGCHVDVSMADALATWTGISGGGGMAGGVQMGGLPSYANYPCADGALLALTFVTEDHFWRKACDVLGLPELADLDTAARMARNDELRAVLGARIAGWNRAPLLAALLAADVPAAPVLSRAEMLVHPHFRARGTVREAPDGALTIGFPAVLSAGSLAAVGPAPALDEHRGCAFFEAS